MSCGRERRYCKDYDYELVLKNEVVIKFGPNYHAFWVGTKGNQIGACKDFSSACRFFQDNPDGGVYITKDYGGPIDNCSSPPLLFIPNRNILFIKRSDAKVVMLSL